MDDDIKILATHWVHKEIGNCIHSYGGTRPFWQVYNHGDRCPKAKPLISCRPH
jgi:hypothetical protein